MPHSNDPDLAAALDADAAKLAALGQDPGPTLADVGLDDPLLPDGFDWCRLEIMGFRKHFGRFREEERFGTRVLRIDVPVVETTRADDGGLVDTPVRWETLWYSGAAIFSIAVSDEATVLRRNRRETPPARLVYCEPAPASTDDLEDAAPESDPEEFAVWTVGGMDP